jgi:hypothetical protein
VGFFGPAAAGPQNDGVKGRECGGGRKTAAGRPAAVALTGKEP